MYNDGGTGWSKAASFFAMSLPCSKPPVLADRETVKNLVTRFYNKPSLHGCNRCIASAHKTWHGPATSILHNSPAFSVEQLFEWFARQLISHYWRCWDAWQLLESGCEPKTSKNNGSIPLQLAQCPLRAGPLCSQAKKSPCFEPLQQHKEHNKNIGALHAQCHISQPFWLWLPSLCGFPAWSSSQNTSEKNTLDIKSFEQHAIATKPSQQLG